MVWGCFCKNGIGRLHVVDGIVNGKHYMKILQNCALPSMKHLYGEGQDIFQQDNAPCNTAKIAKAWIGEHSMPRLALPRLATVLILTPLKIFGTFWQEKVKEGISDTLKKLRVVH